MRFSAQEYFHETSALPPRIERGATRSQVLIESLLHSNGPSATKDCNSFRLNFVKHVLSENRHPTPEFLTQRGSADCGSRLLSSAGARGNLPRSLWCRTSQEQADTLRQRSYIKHRKELVPLALGKSRIFEGDSFASQPPTHNLDGTCREVDSV